MKDCVSKRRKFMCMCMGCGQVIYHRAQVSDLQYGSPFRPCPRCGAEYFDARYREPALEKRIHLARLPRTVVGGLMLGAAFLLGMVYLGEYQLELGVMGLLFFGGSAYLAIEHLRGLEGRRAGLSQELEQSRTRLADPDYVEKLRTAGVAVPKQDAPAQAGPTEG